MSASHAEFSTNVSLTTKAAAKLKELQKARGQLKSSIRFDVKQGFCGAGYEYMMDFASSPQPKDSIFHSEGFEIYVSDSSLSKVCGSVIDFRDSSPNDRLELLMKEGFAIQNPNAKGACPCACDGGFDC